MQDNFFTLCTVLNEHQRELIIWVPSIDASFGNSTWIEDHQNVSFRVTIKEVHDRTASTTELLWYCQSGLINA